MGARLTRPIRVHLMSRLALRDRSSDRSRHRAYIFKSQ